MSAIDHHNPDAAILSQDECFHHRGPLAHPGRLSLSEDLLVFSPSRALDRLAGAENLVIDTAAITELSAGGINHNLDVYVDDEMHRFSGRGAIRVHSRLLALIAQDDVEDLDTLAFMPGERVLVQGQIEMYFNPLLAVRGEITLTDRRLRFTPGLGLEKLIWNGTHLDEPLVEVSNWALRGIRRRLFLRIDDEEHIFGGALTGQLFNRLEALMGDKENSQIADEIVIETWDVQLRRGPVAHPGMLHFTPAQVHFEPTGLFDAIIGVKAFQFSIEDITRISVRGWPEKKLHIRVGHETHSFSLADTIEQFEALRSLVQSRNYQFAMRQGQNYAPRYQKALDSWTTKIDYQLGEQIVFSAFALESKGENEVRFGWLLLLRTRVLFLPLGGPASREDHLSIPIEQACRLDGGPRSRQDQIFMSHEEGRSRFMLSEREGIVEDFWAQCRSPTRILSWESLGPRSMARVMGKSKFIRIMSHGETVVNCSPGMTIEHQSGVAILLPGEPGTSVPLDTWVTVEIGQNEGIYQVDSRVVRAIATPLEGVTPNAQGTHLLIISFPKHLRVYNQRESFRVLTLFDLRADTLAQTADGGSWMATGESYPCQVVDLSIGGCAVDTQHNLREGDRVNLCLPLLDQWIEIRATCVRRSPEPGTGDSTRFGLEFRELSMAQEDILHKAVMALQREALADPGDGQESNEESADQGATPSKTG